jgi:pyrimidine operon attenuation protein/uracil phosphoribosyltransferase
MVNVLKLHLRRKIKMNKDITVERSYLIDYNLILENMHINTLFKLGTRIIICRKSDFIDKDKKAIFEFDLCYYNRDLYEVTCYNNEFKLKHTVTNKRIILNDEVASSVRVIQSILPILNNGVR